MKIRVTKIIFLLIFLLLSTLLTFSAYQVEVGKGNFSETTANDVKELLESSGFVPVEVVQKWKGYSVLIGNYSTKNLAEQVQKDLEGDGYLTDIISTEGGQVSKEEAGAFTIQACSLKTEALANKAREELLEKGYVPVSVFRSGDTFNVLVGRKFQSKEDAEKLLKILTEDGYSIAQVVTSPYQPLLKMAEMDFSKFEAGSPDLRAVGELYKSAILYNSNSQTLDLLITKIKKLEAKDKQIMTDIQAKEKETQEKQKQINTFLAEAGKLADTKNYEPALKYLDKALEIDPNNSRALLRKKSYEGLMRNVIELTEEELKERNKQTQIQVSLDKAKNLIALGRYEEALAECDVVLKLDPTNQEVAKSKLEADKLFRQKTEAENKAKKFNRIITAAVGLGIIAIILGLFALGLKIRKSQKRFEAKISELAINPILDVTGSPEQRKLEHKTGELPEAEVPAEEKPAAVVTEDEFALGGDIADLYSIKTSASSQTAPKLKTETPSPTPPSPAEGFGLELSSEDLFGGIGALTPDLFTEEKPSETKKDFSLDKDLTFSVAGLGESETAGIEPLLGPTEEKTAEEEIVSSKAPSFDELNDIEALITKSDTTKKEPVTPEKQPEVVGASATSDLENDIEMAMSEMQTKKEPAPTPKAEPTVKEKAGEIIFSDGFEDTPVGAQPSKWAGSYDFSKLIVVESPEGSPSKKALLFEKQKGSGSAYYSCNFGNVSGRFALEFDLRCDDKNKYLLGIYIEKDTDFRQSVHTIIHKTDASPQPNIRLHGESVPYEFKNWCHIKYEVNLIEGTVDGYFDGKLVVDRARLAGSPKYMNTLSIRDNLATTGIMYIDNIKIYKLI